MSESSFTKHEDNLGFVIWRTRRRGCATDRVQWEMFPDNWKREYVQAARDVLSLGGPSSDSSVVLDLLRLIRPTGLIKVRKEWWGGLGEDDLSKIESYRRYLYDEAIKITGFEAP